MAPAGAQLAIGSRVKVALVSPYGLNHFGGVQDQVVKLAGWLRDAGHDATVVAPAAGEHGVDVGPAVRVPANRSRAPVALDPRAAVRARQAVAGADVVHLHEPFMPMVGLGVLLGSTPPKVGTFHADPSAAMRAAYRRAAPLLRRAAGRLAVATAVSELARSAVAPVADARIVPNGIDVAAYRVDAMRAAERVAFLGRDDPRKGLAVLLAAWPAVRAAVPGAELAVIGADGRDGGGVHYLGRVPDERKRAELAGAAVYCAPNLGGESFGLVIAEGMAAGCAVVASALPAFQAVLAGAGVTVPPGDADALGTALVAVLRDPPVRARLAGAAAERVAAFDREVVLAEYLRAYRDATGKA